MCSPQQSCKPSMGGVSHLGQTTTEASSWFQRVGVSFTNWEQGIELVVLTGARRGCFCDGCSNALRRASLLLGESSRLRWGPCWGDIVEQDVFYHEVESYDETQVIKGFFQE